MKHCVLLSLACALTVQAASRTSNDYTLTTESADAGGARSTRAAYSHDGSVGGVGGISTAAAPAEIAKHGYLGQLYEVTGLAVAATPASVNEGTTRQLAAEQVLDDGSHLALTASAVAWGVVTGPITGISSSGLAAAGAVYQDALATVKGDHGGFTGTLALAVLDIDPDNFGLYASDRIDDSWQAGYFGPDNPAALPGADPDGDGQSNRLEFTAGLDPSDAMSRFLLQIEPVDAQPSRKRLIFSPCWTDRSYEILTSTTLEGENWDPLVAGETSDNGTQRTVIDPNATEGRKFYRVQVTKP